MLLLSGSVKFRSVREDAEKMITKQSEKLPDWTLQLADFFTDPHPNLAKGACTSADDNVTIRSGNIIAFGYLKLIDFTLPTAYLAFSSTN